MIATGAEIPRAKSIKKPETLRAKIIEKLADGKILHPVAIQVPEDEFRPWWQVIQFIEDTL